VQNVITYGQFGEDGIVDALFPVGFKGRAADVGAYDGINMSNTYLLEQKGWDVVCIEPGKQVQEGLLKARKHVFTVACGKENKNDQLFVEVTLDKEHRQSPDLQEFNTAALSGLAEKTEEQMKEWVWQLYRHSLLNPRQIDLSVNVRTLDWCLEEMRWEDVHFVTIDTEGTDMDVLEGFSIERYKPIVILMENWWEDSRYEDYLAPHGFELIQRIERQNELFLHKERMKELHEVSR
jgi:FkbM family methyltransferase